MKYRTKKKTRNIFVIILSLLLVFGAVGACVSIFGVEKRDVFITEFAVGGVDAEGNYEKRNDTIYTKNLIECQGLEVEPNYDSDISYQIFFYDNHKRFIESTEILTDIFNTPIATAKYCRIMVIPTPGDDVAEDEFKIGYFDVWGYADDFTVRVNKKQDFNLADVFAVCKSSKNSYREGFVATSTRDDYNESELYSVIGPVDCSGVATYLFIFDDVEDFTQQVYFFDVNGDPVESVTYASKDNSDVKIEVPEGSKYMYVNFLTTEEFVINEYVPR